MSSLSGVEGPVMVFGPSLDELAVATPDGRVKLFSPDQQRLVADATAALAGGAAHAVHCCLAWGSAGGGGAERPRLLFLGTTAGEVKCYDAARGALRWAAPAGTLDGGAAALAPLDGGRVLAVGRAGGGALLGAASGEVLARFAASKHPLARAAALPGGRAAVVAGAGVALLDVAGGGAAGRRLHKWTGHATPAAALAVAPGGAHFCSAAEGERFAAVWSLAEARSGRLRHRAAVARLALEEPAAALAAAPAGGDAFYVAAATAAGALRLFACTPTADGGVDAALWAATPPGAAPVLAAAVEASDAGGASLLLACGTAAKPAFVRLRVDRPAAGGGVADIGVAPAAGGGALLPAAGGGGGGGRASLAHHQPRAVLGAPEPAALLNTGAKRAAPEPMEEDADADGGGLAAAAADEEDGSSADEGPTFAERLAALAVGPGGGAPPAAGGAPPAAPAPPPGPLKADSLAVLLAQALQAGDRAMLERVLAVRAPDVVATTVARLPPPAAAALLREAAARLAAAPARGEQLAPWLRACVLHHAGYLAGAGGAGATLAALHQAVEARLASYHALLSLAGRLDLVLAAAGAGAGAGGAGAGAPLGGPLAAVEVGSDGEVEDAYAPRGGGSDSEPSGGSDEGEGGSELGDGLGGSDDDGLGGLDDDGLGGGDSEDGED